MCSFSSTLLFLIPLCLLGFYFNDGFDGYWMRWLTQNLQDSENNNLVLTIYLYGVRYCEHYTDRNEPEGT